jgi:hypothetical protein
MQIEGSDNVLDIVLASLADVRAGRYQQAARRAQTLDDSVYLLGDPNSCLWLTWSTIHYSLYTLASTMSRYDVPEDLISRMHEELATAEALFRNGWEHEDIKLVFTSLEQITNSAGDVSHAANFFGFRKMEGNDD